MVRLTLLTMVLATCSSCGDYVKHLPNGYLLGRVNADDISIAPPKRHVGNPTHPVSGRAVPPRIEKIDVVGDYVLGFVKYDAGVYGSKKKYEGYFILNTVSGQVQLGLPKAKWKSLLESYGVRKTTLVHPDDL